MLLSHNFNLYKDELPALGREEFAQIFINGLKGKNQIACRHIDNPHWIVEIIFPSEKFEAQEIGQLCGEILTSTRKKDLAKSKLTTDTLILGGKKTSPVANNLPNTLQPGEWGVDVVETAQADVFLAAINWEILTEGKSKDDIFRIDFLKN